METPSFRGSASGMAGQTVKQLPQYMHLSSSTLTVVLPSIEVGRIALFGHEATVVGISHWFGSALLSIRGGVRCRPRIAMSEAWTAPHMFRQQATATRSLAGSFSEVKYSASSSMTAFTKPEASVAAEWQCTQPWVWTT